MHKIVLDTNIKIVKIKTNLVVSKLRRPYRLSFATLEEFESILVYISTEDGSRGVGEAVALPGYSWETTYDIQTVLSKIIKDMEGKAISKLISRCESVRHKSPFAAAAVMTALEFPLWIRNITRSHAVFPLNYPIATHSNIMAIEKSILPAIQAGFKYIKVKVGQNLENDLLTAESLLKGVHGGGYKLVFDANQAYEYDESLEFIRLLEKMPKERFLWLEQPLKWDDWQGNAALCSVTSVPIILDESIYTEEDILRASEIGAFGVKLKLFKNFGFNETRKMARKAHALGLKVVLGNGVASDIGNLCEYLLLLEADGLFAPPAESNGFSKLEKLLAPTGLMVDQSGNLTCSLNSSSVLGLENLFM